MPACHIFFKIQKIRSEGVAVRWHHVVGVMHGLAPPVLSAEQVICTGGSLQTATTN